MTDVEAHQRLAALIDINAIRCTASVAGLGRVGMAIAKRLMEYPIRKIIGIDHDEVSEKEKGNVFPRGCNERYKVRAAGELVQFWNEAIEYEPVLMKISKSRISRLIDIVNRTDLFFWCADGWKALQNVVSVLHPSVRCVGVSMAEGGSYGEIAWSVPGQTACIACSLNASEKITERAAASLPVDVDAVANVAVSCGLGLMLARRRGFELFRHLLEPSHPLLIVHNRANSFTTSKNQLVPQLVRLVRVDTSCSVCRSVSVMSSLRNRGA